MEDEVIIDEQVDTGDPDPREKLYKGLREQELYTKSFDEFKAKYSTPEEIKKLYSGLSEQQLYTKSEDDFVKQYFPQSNGMAKPEEPQPAQAVDQFGKKVTPATDDEVFGLANERGKVREQGGDLRLNTIDESLKAAGYNPDVVEREFKGMPTLPGFNAKQALALKEENPNLYDRKKAAIKSQVGLMQAVENKTKAEVSQYEGKEVGEKAGKQAGKDFLKTFLKGQYAPDYQAQRKATVEAREAVYKYVDNADDQRKIIADLATDKSYGYGIGLPGTEEAIAADPRSSVMNPYMVTGMHFLEDMDPATAKSYNRLLAFSPEEIEANKGNTSFMRGLEAKQRELEDIGMNVTQRSLEEKMTSMLPNKPNWKPEDQQEYNKLFDKYQTLNKDKEGQRERYPMMAVMDADMKMQDALGESKRGVVAQTALGIGEKVDDVKNWFGALMKAPFISETDNAVADLELLGDKRLSQLNQYETKGEELFERGVTTVFKGDLKKQIDEIKANESLTDAEKQQEITGAIVKDNRKNVDFITNEKAGKMNFTAKTVINTVSNVASDIIPQIALAYLTGGGAASSKMGELMHLFGSTFATSYMSNYTDALEKNIANPTAYATAHTTIDAATELLGNNIEMAKRLFRGKLVGQILEKEGAEALSRNGKFSKLLEAFKQAGKEGTKDAYMEGLEEFSGAGLNNMIDKYEFGQDVNLTDDMNKSFVTTAIGLLPLGILGLPGHYKSINRAHQYAVTEAGMNPEKYNIKVDQDLAAGYITQPEADKRKKIIAAAAAAVQTMPQQRADGSSMTDNEKAKFITNEVVLGDIKEAETGASKEVKADLDLQTELITAEQQQLITPPEPKLKREVVEENRAEALATAKDQYIGMPRKFQTEQRAKINARFDEQMKEVEKQEAEDLKEEEAAEAEKEAKAAKEETAKAEEAKPKAEDTEPIQKEEEAQTAPIETEDDLLKALKDVGKLEPGINQSESVATQPESVAAGVPESTGGTVKQNNKGLGNNLQENGTNKAGDEKGGVQSEGMDGRPLGPLAEAWTNPGNIDRHMPMDLFDIKPDDNLDTVIEKLTKSKGEFNPLFKFIQKLPIYKKIKFEVYEEGKNPLLDKYLTMAGADPKTFGGFYSSHKKVNSANPVLRDTFDKLKGTMALMNPTNAYYAVAHELLHAVTLDNVSNWKKFTTASDAKLLENIYKYIKSQKKYPPGMLTNDNYGLYSVEEFMVESLMNKKFRDHVSDVMAKGPADFKKQTQDKGRDFIKVITDFIANMLDKVFSRGAYTKGLSDKPLIDKAVELGTKLFLQGNPNLMPEQVKTPEELEKDRKYLAEMERDDAMMSGNLNDPTDFDKMGSFLPNKVDPREEAIKNIIKRSKPNLSDEVLKKHIVEATGIDEATVQGLIDEVRTPPPAPPAGKDVADLTPEEVDFYYKQFKKIFDYKEPPKPSAFSKAWDSLKNASAAWDNPYRFVTKITDDIYNHYKTDETGPREEAIPLGRVFEKSAVGKAALKTSAFKNSVVDGNINGENLGKLKGEKYEDFQEYMAARRIIDRLDKQEEKQQAGEEVNRATGNVTRRGAEIALQKLEEKYPRMKLVQTPSGYAPNVKEDVLADFEKRAQAFQDNMDLMLQNLTATGILGQEAYDDIKANNDFYAPFNVVRSQMPSGKKQGAGIAGVVKRIKGIGFDLHRVAEESPVEALNALADALDKKAIGPDAYFDAALEVVDNALATGKITKEEYDKHIENMASPGFEIKNMIDAAANMIYKAEGMALKNTMMQRLYEYKDQDHEGLFIQDTDYLTPMTVGSEVRMVTKPLDQINVEEGMAPVKVKINGKDVVVAVNEKAADKINGMSNFEMPALIKGLNAFNRVFRFFVITTSPGFQLANLIIDTTRTAMMSRYGVLTGKGLVEPIVNALLYAPQLVDALIHSTAGNLGVKTKSYKQWMESDSFSKGMYDNLFNEQGEIKDINASTAKKVLMNFLKLKFVEIPGSILEQTHKLMVYQRGMAVEGFQPEMATAMLASMFNNHVAEDMTPGELTDAMDRLNYEVQNFAGSPNFPQTAPWLKAASIFLQFFSARVKGEMSDYRRMSNIILGRGEGVKLTKQETWQMAAQFAAIASVIAAYALKNNGDDDDEKEFDTQSSWAQDNYLNIPGGEFNYVDEHGTPSVHREYIKIPLRGLTASMNVMANKFIKFKKGTDPEGVKKAALAVAGNTSPLNLSGKDEREYGESVVSNLTPVFKYGLEYSFNRDTHAHRDLVYPYKLIEGFRTWNADKNPDIDQKKGVPPWKVVTRKTPPWCAELSEFMYRNLGISIAAATLDHMERTMGNPTELYNKALSTRFKRSEARYPVQDQKPTP